MEKYFPVFYDITDWNICFFGSGRVAERRLKTLCRYDCHLFVISDEVTDAVGTMIKEKKVIWVQKNIREETAEQQITQIWKILKETYPNCFQKEKRFSMVFACTNRRNINRKIYEYCKQRNIQVNTADRRQESDFYFPGLLEYEDVIIGVTGNGKNHKKVKTVMDKLREVFNKNI